MGDLLPFDKVEKLVVRDKKLLFTLTSYVLVLIIYVNLNVFESPLFGISASIAYFLINGIFLGSFFVEKEDPFFKFMLGVLLLVMLLGFVSWLAVVIQDLNVTSVTIVLFIVATISSALNRTGIKVKNVP